MGTLAKNSGFSAKRLSVFHQAAFDMRHKILPALQELPETADACLGEVSEFDETFVLDCYKGRRLDGTVTRTARKHGAKAKQRGISNEYICICTGIRRKGEAIAATVNRAKPSAAELIAAYRNAEAMVRRLTEAVLTVTGVNYYHSNKDIRTVRLVAI